jgi:hypothetical protein
MSGTPRALSATYTPKIIFVPEELSSRIAAITPLKASKSFVVTSLS